MRERVEVKSPVRENRPPGSVRGAPGNRRPYRDHAQVHATCALQNVYDIWRPTLPGASNGAKDTLRAACSARFR